MRASGKKTEVIKERRRNKKYGQEVHDHRRFGWRGFLDNASRSNSSRSSSNISGSRRKAEVFFSLKRGKWRKNCNHVLSEQLQFLDRTIIEFPVRIVEFYGRKWQQQHQLPALVYFRNVPIAEVNRFECVDVHQPVLEHCRREGEGERARKG